MNPKIANILQSLQRFRLLLFSFVLKLQNTKLDLFSINISYRTQDI